MEIGIDYVNALNSIHQCLCLQLPAIKSMPYSPTQTSCFFNNHIHYIDSVELPAKTEASMLPLPQDRSIRNIWDDKIMISSNSKTSIKKLAILPSVQKIMNMRYNVHTRNNKSKKPNNHLQNIADTC